MAAAEKPKRAWIRELFIRMDRNGDGTISRQELKSFLTLSEMRDVASKLQLPHRMTMMAHQFDGAFEQVRVLHFATLVFLQRVRLMGCRHS